MFAMEEEKPEKVSPDFENKEKETALSESSSATSRASTPDKTNGLDVQLADQVSPEKIQQDVASRGIIRPKKPLSNSSLRGSFISNAPLLSDSESSLMNTKVGIDDNNDIIDRPASSASTSSSTDIHINDDEYEGPELVKLGERTTSFITRSSNETVELSTVCTQTENSWLKDIDLFEELLKQKPEWIDKIKLKRKESRASAKGNYIIYQI